MNQILTIFLRPSSISNIIGNLKIIYVVPDNSIFLYSTQYKYNRGNKTYEGMDKFYLCNFLIYRQRYINNSFVYIELVTDIIMK